MIVIAPVNAPQLYVSPLNGVEHPLAPAVMNAMLRHGNRPVSLWRVINGLANARNPDSRDRLRCWRLRYWGAVRELRRAGLLVRHGPLVATSNFATRPKPRSPRRLPPSVGGSTSEIGGSIPVVSISEIAASNAQAPETEVVVADVSKPTCTIETKSAPPTRAEIKLAASALAGRPRKAKRPWTGYLEGERVKRGSLVQVPTGELLPVYVVLRGKVLVALPDELPYANRVFERYDASHVRRIKLPEAQLLGALKPGAGSRPRGRPRRLKPCVSPAL